jgi:hypothetical protein
MKKSRQEVVEEKREERFSSVEEEGRGG